MSIQRRLIIGLAAGAFLTGTVRAQQGGITPEQVKNFAKSNFTPVASNYGNAPLLRSVVSIEFDQASLRTVLLAISQQIGSRLLYEESVISLPKRVTIKREGVAAGMVLREIFAGTDVAMFVSEAGGFVVLKRVPGGMGAVVREGSIAGRVTDKVSSLPIPSAQVIVSGTKLFRYTDEKGQFRIAAVPSGDREIVVRRLGYEPVSRKVHITDGETATVDVTMEKAATALTQVVTTATGERSRLEVGNSIGTIKADSLVATNLIRNASDLLQARTPGVIVGNVGGRVGAPSKIRIRGLTSVQLNNDPIIILDGVRLNWLNTTSLGSGGSSQTSTGSSFQGAAATPARLDDIDPNTIESIDVLRGPSAASLYGTEAANGVIVIKTKRGAPGAFRFNVLADDGWSGYPGAFPATYHGWGHTPTGGVSTSCVSIYFNNCIQDSVNAFNAANNPNLSGIGSGSARNLSTSLSGGSQALQEFLSLRATNNVGILKLPQVEQNRIAATWGEQAPAWMQRPNTEQILNGSSRTSVRVNDKLDLQFSVNGVYRSEVAGSDALSSSGTYLGPWDTLAVLPAENMRNHITGVFKRGFISTNASYVPLSWLTLTGALGGDYTLRTDNQLQRAADCTTILAPTTGCASTHTNARDETFVTTMNMGAQLSFNPTHWLGLRTALGEQFSGTHFYTLSAASSFSANLAFGTDLLTPAPVATSGTPQLYSITENRDQSATAGFYIEQTASFRERLFVTAAFREDAGSAFGPTINKKLPTYPKFSFSWLASDEDFFPYKKLISSFRLRAAYGHSGNQARQTDVLPNYTITTGVVDNTTTQIAVLSQIPNPVLKPERVTEAEGGFDLSLFDNERIHFEATMYRKMSEDAIVNISTPGSFGAVTQSQRVNLGSVENRGTELSLTAKLIDSRSFGWDISVNYTDNKNTLVKINTMGRQVSNNSLSYMPGYPLFGAWSGVPGSWADLNGDGILNANEVSRLWGTDGIPAASMGGFTYGGPPYPKSEITYTNGFTLFSGVLRLSALFDQVNDKYIPGTAGGAQCWVAPTTCTVDQQAAVIRWSLSAGAGLVTKVSWVKLSELSATYNVPRRAAQRYLLAQSAAITFAGRNLLIRSNYGWKDPSGDLLSDNSTTSSGASGPTGIGQPQSWTLRLNLGF